MGFFGHEIFHLHECFSKQKNIGFEVVFAIYIYSPNLNLDQ